MALKPWYKVVNPREDLREGTPLDASEFAVHLDHVREKRAAAVYQEPERFFERTFLTQSLKALGAGVLRRMSGIKVETSAVYNLTTQFGGGKTHSLTALYHLAQGGPAASQWRGVKDLLDQAKITSAPAGAVAVFVGQEFDALNGRGGDDGTPVRHTPWGEIAFQLGGSEAFAVVAEHDEKRIAPSSEAIRKFLPKDRPVLILMDELINFMNRYRKIGLKAQLYNFMQNLSEEARGQDRVVLAVSLPSMMDEMTPEDEADHDRFEKLLNRVGKSMMMAVETETSEIIRRRLFEWNGLPEEAKKTIREYADWVQTNKSQLPTWFPVDNAYEAFAATYPLHPTLLSVFERKWQQLQRFQQTRGILRLLALWISHVFHTGFKDAQNDPLIGMGTAPLHDPDFRAAVFEQLGMNKLEGAVTTDIAGKKDSHSIRLDKEALESLKKAHLHQRAATVIFFESNGGQTKAEATLPEVRLAVAEPSLDIGNVETAVEGLTSTCYYLSGDKHRYRFSPSPNLIKTLNDRVASVQPARIADRIKSEIKKIFDTSKAVDLLPFPENSGQIPDRPTLTLVYLSPLDHSNGNLATRAFVERATKEHGSSARTFKSGLVWAIPENCDGLREDARKALAWEDIEDDKDELRLEDHQKRQLAEALERARRDVKETVWRTYKTLMLLGKDGPWKTVDLGLVHSSSAKTLVELIVRRLTEEGDILDSSASPHFVAKRWPPALPEWSTKSVRDAFFSSPAFPKLRDPATVKDTIARGVQNGVWAYVGKGPDNTYSPFEFQTTFTAQDVEISDDMFIIPADVVTAYKQRQTPPKLSPGPHLPQPGPLPSEPTGPSSEPGSQPPPLPGVETVSRFSWNGEIPPQKWMNFYTKVLTRFASGDGLKLHLRVEVAPREGVPIQKVQDAKVALRELGLKDEVESES